MSDDDTGPGTRLAHLPPLGWVAKRIEDGLTDYVDTLFSRGFGMGRRHWQLLRWIAEHDSPRAEAFVTEAATFYTEAQARRIVDDLVARGWVRCLGRPDGRDPELALTTDGRSGFEAMRVAQGQTWSVVLDGLGETDYAAVVTAMNTMADNLERANLNWREDPR